MDGWTEVKCIMSPDGHRKVVILQGAHGLFRFDVLSWQKYYEASAADLEPVEDGIWYGAESGLFESATAAEVAARQEVDWLGP
ncbi:MAG TPA: hypothetical protein VGO52_06420 [Hyphomonadaceae bacterium]|jgi:hypothetical protein|nr:hypothetical protein [Hyphomonadaceae bacterium]